MGDRGVFCSVVFVVFVVCCFFLLCVFWSVLVGVQGVGRDPICPGGLTLLVSIVRDERDVVPFRHLKR